MDVLVDLSELKVTPKKHFTTTRKFNMSAKEGQHAPKLLGQNCATGILIDFSDPDGQPEKIATDMAEDQSVSVSSEYSKTPDESNMSESHLIYLEGPGFDISPQSAALSSFGRSKNAENSYLAHSPLNAHQMAEIFEQANTIAVRIELANAKQHTCHGSTSATESSPVSNKENNDQFSAEGIVTDERLKATTSTPTEKVVPDVNAHFWGAESGKSVCLEMDEEATVSDERRPMEKKQTQLVRRTMSVKQLSMDTNQRKTLIGRASVQRAAKDGAHATATALLAPKIKTDSIHNTGISAASSTTSVGSISLKALKSEISQAKSNADRGTTDVLTRSLDSPSVPTGRTGIRRPSESMEMLAGKKRALVLKPFRNLPQRPPGRSGRKEIGVEHGTNPTRVSSVNKLQPKQSIPRKVESQITSAEKSGNQSKKL